MVVRGIAVQEVIDSTTIGTKDPMYSRGWHKFHGRVGYK